MAEQANLVIAPHELRTKRSALTRCTTRINAFLEPAEETLETLQQAQRLHEQINTCWQELQAAMAMQIAALAAADDQQRINTEYERQEPYQVQWEDHREKLQLRIDRLTNILEGSSQIAEQKTEELAISPVEDKTQENFEQEIFGEEGEHPGGATCNEQSASTSTPWEQHGAEPLAVPLSVKDPENKITKFSGDPSRFKKWWSIFSVYVDSQPFAAVEKFRLLEGALTGKAAKAVAHLDFNDHSYEVAKDIISRRFGNGDQAAASHVHSIHAACMWKDLDHNDKFIDFVSYIGQHIRTLLTLGGSFEALSITITPVILGCLPLEHRKKFKEISKLNLDPKISSLQSLLNYLEEEAMLLEECLKPTKKHQNKNSKSIGGKKDKFNKGDSQARPERSEDKSKYSFASGVSSPDNSCLFCKKDHPSAKCSANLSPEQRKRCVESQGACLKCLRKNHDKSKCRAKIGKCSRCSGSHHVMVCLKPAESASSNVTVSSVPSPDVANFNTPVANAHLACNSQKNSSRDSNTFLQTGYVWAESGYSKKICRILLDPGSQKSFVTRRVTTALQLSPISSQRLKIFGITGLASSEDQVNIFELKLKSRFSNQQITISCIEVPNVIGSEVPRISNAVFNGELECIADVRVDGYPDEIDLIIGSDYLHLIYDGMYRRFGNLIASPTIFGWFVWGSDGVNQVAKSVITSLGVCQSIAAKSKPPKDKSKQTLEDLDFLWDVEFLGINQSNPDEEGFSITDMEFFFNDTIQRTSEGRYIVSLPFKSNISQLGQNQELAFSRLIALLKNAKKNPKLLKAIDEEIERVLVKGFAEPAEPCTPNQKSHFLPLVAVAKKSLADSGEPRVRIVKDGGARCRDEASLNDVLEAGPSLVPDLIHVLLHFRRRPTALTVDIESAFSQFLINKDQRTYLRFYWPLGISKDPNAPIREFWGRVLNFGLNSSTFLHTKGIRHHLDSAAEKRPHQARFLGEIRHSFYVDDICTNVRSVKEAESAVSTLIEVFNDGHFPLNKWSTNCEKVAEFIRSVSASEDCVVTTANPSAKFLGIYWNQIVDSLFTETDGVEQALRAGTATKRHLLKCLSQIFDPLNLICPITINFKMLFQKLWQKQIDWDTPLEGDLKSAYDAAVSNLSFAKLLQIKRSLFLLRRKNSRRELHVFADASLLAYGCVAYVREIPLARHHGQVSVGLVLAKARVAPLKGKWTIPRLELIAAVIATRIAKCIKEALPDQFDETFLYSDSSSVLGWVRDKPERWKSFVANRIREIHANSDVSSWNFVRSADNPSDLLTRGIPLDTPDLRGFWLAGPSWLQKSVKPENHPLNCESRPEVIREQKREIAAAMSTVSEPTQSLFHKNFSSWPKAVRIFAYVRRFLRVTQRTTRFTSKMVETEEFEEAETALFKYIQRLHFSEEIETKALDVRKSSQLFRLSPFLGKDELIRCRSRLAQSKNLFYDEKYPIILPKDDVLVDLFSRWIHEEACLHAGGLAAALQRIREKFFIICARRVVRKAISGCKVCVRYKARQAAHPVRPLPDFRIHQCVPFACCGIDNAGPIYIKGCGEERQKSYILLMVCAATRAMRLELVADLSTKEFMLALRRFISRNPGVSRIVSDNAKNFKRANDELDSIFDHVKTSKVNEFLVRKRIQWQYSTKKAPWQNGFFERLVSVVKKPLRKILGTHALSFRELETVLTEIEKVANDRPISAVTCDPDEPRALAPSDLLYGYATQPHLPETSAILKQCDDAKAIIFSERFKNQQSILRAFWKRFQNEYLQYLRSIHYREPQESRPLRPGDVCILHSRDASRAYWPLVRILSVYGGRGTDGNQRSCEIKTVTGKVLRRPIQLLYPLEVSTF